jgi:choice-of-anchor C domain-containing protein
MNLKRIFSSGAVAGLVLVGCGGVEPSVEADEAQLGSTEQGLQVATNGSFEAAPSGVYNYQNLSAGSTALTNWTIGGGIKVMNSSYKTAAQGTKSVDLNSSYGAGSISQMVPTVVGSGYTVRFAIANGATCGGQWRYGTVTYGPSSASISNSNAGWTYRSYVFNATSTSSLIKFESTSTGVGCGIAIDDVTVTGP